MNSQYETLLQPISSEHPSGQSLRYEAVYTQIREARREDDASLPQGVWQTQLKQANWAQVGELCQKALARESKDLQLAAWLTEAWLLQDGLEGLEQGLRLLGGLVERFWDSAWPALDGEDTEARLSPIKWLDDRLPLVLPRVTLSSSKAPGAPTLGDWQQILRREKDGTAAPPPEKTDSGATPAAEGPLTRETFLAAAAQIPTADLVTLEGLVAHGLEAAAAFEQALDARLGQSFAGLRRTRSTLEGFQSLLALLKGQRPTEPSMAGSAVGSAPTPGAAPGRRLTGAIQSREEAYQHLALAADYLLRTEPHSPVPYLVKRAMTWGGMPLGQLLGELVSDDSGLSAIHHLLGLKQAN